MRRIRDQEDAVSGSIGFVVALLVFTVVTASVFEFSAKTPASEKAETAELYITSVRLADRIFGQAGAGWFKPGFCQSDAVNPDHFDGDNVSDFGLRAETCGSNFNSFASNHVDFYKVRNLYDAGQASSANNRTDYEDMASLLGLDGTGLQFHLTGEPVLPSLVGGAAADYSLHVAYVGDYNYQVVGQQGPGLPVPDCIPTPAGCMPPACPLGCLVPTDIYGWVPRNSTLNETRWLDYLAGPFDRAPGNASYNHTDLPREEGGDVYADDTNGLVGNLKPLIVDAQGNGVLTTYDTIVVGAGVASNQMNGMRDALEAWVETGGTLIVLGSDQDLQWTESRFKVKLKGGAGTAAASDPEDALLTGRNELDWAAYDDLDRFWEFNAGAGTPYRHVLSDQEKDYLVVSRDGEFGKGRIVLSAFQPDRMYPAQASCAADRLADGSCEPLRFLHNAFSIPYEVLYISYGGTPPTHKPVSDHTRVVTTFHPYLTAHISVRFAVAVWHDGAPTYTTSPPVPANTFPWDFVFLIETASAGTTYYNETYTAQALQGNLEADLEDYALVATQYRVNVDFTPPCGMASGGSFSVPDPSNILAPLTSDGCGLPGMWTVDIGAQAAPLATGSLRVHVSEIP